MTSFTTTTSTSNTSHSSNSATSTAANKANNTSSASSSARLSNSSQPTVNSACAACKYQRRKCKPDCTLAPFFPASNQQKFLNAHRLFGVSNINKIINNLDPCQRAEAMKTIIIQSDMRAHDPVGGCLRYIRELQHQLEQETAQLEYVLGHLNMCRAQAAAAVPQPISAVGGISTIAPDINPNLLLNTPTAADDAGNVIYDVNIYPSPLNPNSSLSQQQQQHEQQHYYFYDDSAPAAAAMSRDLNNLDVHTGSNNNLPNQQQQHCSADVKPLVEMFDRGKLIGPDDDEGDSISKNSNVISLRSRNLELKDDQDQVEHMPEEELRSAASEFTLTHSSSSAL